MALGSITPDFTYNSEKGAHAIALELDSDLLGLQDTLRPKVYVNGGPYFVQIAPDDCVKTLAWYSGGNDTRKPAIVECEVGLGKAILCGPHVEYDAEELDKDAKSAIASEETRRYLSRIVPSLLNSNTARGILMKKLLERLGLTLNSVSEESSLSNMRETPIYSIPLTQTATTTSDKLKKAGRTKDTND
jgi:biotin--protein ligase